MHMRKKDTTLTKRVSDNRLTIYWQQTDNTLTIDWLHTCKCLSDNTLTLNWYDTGRNF